VTTGAIRRTKLQSNHHHQQTICQLLTGRMPFLSPNQQRQSTEGRQNRTLFLTGGKYVLCIIGQMNGKRKIRITTLVRDN